MEMRYHMMVHGKVQGIFFRDSTVKAADKIGGIKGYVRNLPDGTVEVVAEGKEPQLKKLLAFCREGPPLAKVEKVVVQEKEATGEFKSFEVRY